MLTLKSARTTNCQINSLYTEFHFLEVLLRLFIPCMIRISTSAISQHWKLQLSILPSSLSEFMTSATPTNQQAYNGQGPPTSECFSRLKTVYSARNGALKKAEEAYLCPFVSKRRELPKPVPTKAFLQPAKAAAMCTAPRAETHLPPPIPPFWLAQNLSSKWIAPTDNMRLKLHNEYICHQWLKGKESQKV